MTVGVCLIDVIELYIILTYLILPEHSNLADSLSSSLYTQECQVNECMLYLSDLHLTFYDINMPRLRFTLLILARSSPSIGHDFVVAAYKLVNFKHHCRLIISLINLFEKEKHLH